MSSCFAAVFLLHQNRRLIFLPLVGNQITINIKTRSDCAYTPSSTMYIDAGEFSGLLDCFLFLFLNSLGIPLIFCDRPFIYLIKCIIAQNKKFRKGRNFFISVICFLSAYLWILLHLLPYKRRDFEFVFGLVPLFCGSWHGGNWFGWFGVKEWFSDFGHRRDCWESSGFV